MPSRMRRRRFLRHQLALAGGLVYSPYHWLERLRLPASGIDDVRISAITVHRLTGATREYPVGPWQGSVTPLHLYPEHRPPTPPAPVEPGTMSAYTPSALYLRIATDDGVSGLYGPIDEATAPVITGRLSGFLAGRNPLAGERLWDELYRLDRHARSGHFMMAISAVDNALWDLRGRYFEAPVYELLGGPTRARIPLYASALGRSVQPGEAAESARGFAANGFGAQKWFLPYGPGDGARGLAFNVDLVRRLREAVGEEYDLMFDAFGAWDLAYALRWAEAVQPYRPRWIEEAFLPAELGSFAELSRRTSIPVAAGEHLYNRWDVHRYLEAGAAAVIQADPEWCGGVTELTKICALASTYGVPVVPHGHNLHAALHVVASQSPAVCPLAEYLHDKMQGYYHFEREPLRVVDGAIELPRTPGFGLAWDERKIERSEVVEE